MANWITHTILADRLLKRGIALDKRGFCLGNIAPDCNVENEDWTAFTPPREVTHWMRGGKETADYEGFYSKHIADRNITDPQELAFLYGYYCHLVTDAQYQIFVRDPVRLADCFARLRTDDELANQIAALPETFDALKAHFGRRRLFRDIAVLENNYAATHPHCSWNTVLRTTEAFPDYLSDFPSGAVTRKLKVMVFPPDPVMPETGLFFTREEYNAFLDNTEDLLLQHLKEKLG